MPTLAPPSRRHVPRLLQLSLIAAIVTFLGIRFSTTAFAANINVNGTGDATVPITNGLCELREAIQAATTNLAVDGCPAGSAVGADTINLPVNATISLATGQLTLSSDMVINANGTTITAAGNSRVFLVSGGNVTMNNIIITGGGNNPGNPGAGIRNLGTLTLNSSTVTGNHSASVPPVSLLGGGGISNEAGAVLILDNTTVSNNTAFTTGSNGGGILNDNATVTIQNGSSVTGNTADNNGGGIASNTGTVNITNGTITNNTATNGNGGGLYLNGATLNTSAASISNNSLANIYNNGGPTLTIIKVTDPAANTPSFDFTFDDPNTVSAPDSSFSLSNGGSQPFAGLIAGDTYDVSESVPTGWQLEISCVDTNTNGSVNYSRLPATGDLVGARITMPATDVTCTFENVQRGQIVIVKEADPKSNLNFVIDAVGGTYTDLVRVDDPLVDDGDNATKSKTFTNVPIGTAINLNEQPRAGWRTESIVCTNASGSVVANALFSNQVNVTLATAGETLTCTFYNVQSNSAVGLVKTPLHQQVSEGDDVNFTLHVAATGGTALTNVTVTDDLCDNGQVIYDSGDTGADEVLGVGEVWVYSCLKSNVGEDDFVNTATVSAMANGVSVTDNAAASVDVRSRGIDLDKYTDTGSTVAFQFAPVNFILEVRNTSEVATLYNVAVVDPGCVGLGGFGPPDSGDTNANNDLDANEVWIYTCTIPSILVFQDFTNEATVSACTGDASLAQCVNQGYAVLTDRDFVDISVINPDLEIEKTPTEQTVVTNGSATFDIYVRNLGDQNLLNLVVGDIFCDGGAPTPVLTGNVNVGDENSDGILNPGETWQYACTVSDVGETSFTNTATATAKDPNGNTIDDYDEAEVLVINPVINLLKRPATQDVREGEDAQFRLVVENTGDQDLIHVDIIDLQCDVDSQFDPNTRFGPLANPTSYDMPTIGDDNNDGKLNPGERWVYRFCVVKGVTEDFENSATVKAIDPLGNEVSDDDIAAVNVLSAGIDIEKDVDPTTCMRTGETACISIYNTPVTFRMEVQNTGQANLSNVTVLDPRCDLDPVTLPNPLAAPVSGDAGILGVLEPNEIWTYECTINNVVTNFTNYAEVSATDGINAVDDDDIYDVRVVNPRIFLEKLPKNASVLQGSNVDFTLNVRNLGDQNLTITSFSDPLCANPPTYVSGDDGDNILEPGEIWKYTCTVMNVQADFTNVAVVKAKDPNGIEVQDTENAEIDVVSAGIDLKKTADTPQIFQGQTAKFTLAVKKTGAEDLRSVDIIDAKCGFAEHVNPNDASNPPTSGDTNSNGILENNETWIYECSIPNAVADFTNSARVKAREVTTGLPVEASASASVDVLNPGINVEKSTNTPVVAQGSDVTFQISVQNTGQSDLSNVVLQDALCVGGTPTIVAGGIGVLQPTEIWLYECKVTNVQDDFDNTVTVTALDPAGNQVSHNATAHVDVVNPNIDLEKTPENQTILAGANAQFTLRIKNTGDLDLHDVALTDAFCDGGAPTLVSKGDNDANNLLSPNEVWEYSCVRSGVQADFTNTASVTALDPANKQVGDSEQAIVNVIQPGMTLNKRPESQAVLKGGTATFFLDVTNTGDANLNKVAVNDVLCSAAPTLVSGDDGDNILEPGETWTYSCTRANVVEDFINLATVTFADETGAQLTRTDTAEVDVINGGIDIEKSADNTTVLKGQSVKFTLNVLNTGQTPLTITEIKDPMCDAAPVLVDDGDGDALLAVNETWRYECIKSNLQAGFTNIASVKGIDANNNAVSDVDDITIKVLNPAIDLEKTPEFQAVLQGDTAEFILEVRNIGDQVLSNIVLVDAECTSLDFLGGDTNDDGLLQTNEVWRWHCEVANVTHNFTNMATVTAADSSNHSVSDTEEAEVEVVDPGVDLQKTADEPTILKGETAKFTIIVRNTGDQPLSITDISDPLCDADPVFVGGDGNNNGKLDLTEFWIYTCSKANTQEDFTNTATVTAEDVNGIEVTSSDSADIDVINPGIDLEKSAQNQSVIEGDNASFTLSVRNTGQSDLTNVVVSDTLCDIGPDYVTFTGVGNGNTDGILQIGEVWIYSCIVLNVQEDLTNQASVTAKDVAGNTVSDLDQATVEVVKVGMNVKMQASSLVVDNGDDVEFTIVVRNTGEEDLQSVNVAADTCAPTYESGDANGDQTLQPSESWVYVCNIGNVTGASLTTTVTVSAQDANGNVLSREDTVVISALQPDVVEQNQFLYLPVIQR